MSARPVTLLIADDDPMTRDVYKAAAERRGYKVLLAEDGERAIKTVELGQVTVVLLDILMPNKEGLETLIELKRRFPDVSVIVMSAGSGRSKADFLSVAAKFGADGTLKKPFVPQMLFDLVEGTAAQSRSTAG